jgi:hypothetical protein
MTDEHLQAAMAADCYFLRELAASFDRIHVRPKGVARKHKEEAAAGTEQFRVKAERLRLIAESIERGTVEE